MFHQLELKLAFEKEATRKKISEGVLLMEPGAFLQIIPIVISGCIRVLRQNAEGEETFLYHIMPGETCALSLTCCATHRPSEIKAITEEETEIWTIPVQFVEQWQQFKEWKEFIAITYQTRFNKMLDVIDNIAFKHLDERLWQYLKSRASAKHTDTLYISHEEIAHELNIQREAATRLIKKLKEHGYIETGRNEIKLLKK